MWQIDFIDNFLMGVGFAGLALMPVWVVTSMTSYILRINFFFCGVHHLMRAAYMLTRAEPPMWERVWDTASAFIAILLIIWIVKDKERITTVRADHKER